MSHGTPTSRTRTTNLTPAEVSAMRRHILPRVTALLAAVALAAGAILTSPALRLNTAKAEIPFPIADMEDGEYDAARWAVDGTEEAFKPTADGWLRLTDGDEQARANMLMTDGFPAQAGLSITFDYRMVGRALHDGRPGDGFSIYLVDGEQPGVSAGGEAGGLGYSFFKPDMTGVLGAYLGVGLDEHGGFAQDDAGSVGGDKEMSRKSIIGMRGSGNGKDLTAAGYPWIGGAEIGDLMTGPTGATDPAKDEASMFRRVQITVHPTAQGAVEASVALSPATLKDTEPTRLTEAFRADLSKVLSQAPLPASLKLGIGVATDGGTAIMDIKNLYVRGLTDTRVVTTMTTPGFKKYQAPAYVGGQSVTLSLTATNDGPQALGDPPAGPAVLYSDLTSIFENGHVWWLCTGKGGAVCGTEAGTDPTVDTTWWGPAGSSVTVKLTGTIRSDLAPGIYDVSAMIPTDLAAMKVSSGDTSVSEDGSVTDYDLSNNVDSCEIEILTRKLDLMVTASPFDRESIKEGQEITISHEIVNSGSEVISRVNLTQHSFSGTGKISPFLWSGEGTPGVLDPGQKAIATATYTLSEKDANAGGISYSAHAIGEGLDGGRITTPHAATVVGALMPTPERSTVSTSRGSKVAGVEAHEVTLVLNDEDGDAVEEGESAVTAKANPPGGVVIGPVTHQPTIGDGVYSFTVESTSAGKKDITVAFSSGGKLDPLPLTFVAGDLASSTFAMQPETAHVGEKATAKVSLADAYGNALPNAEVLIAAPGLFSGEKTIQTNAAGEARLELTTNRAGTYSVHASYQGSKLAASPATVVFAPSEPCFDDDVESLSGLVLNKTSQQVGESVTAQVLVADCHDNFVGAGHRVRLTIRDRKGDPIALRSGEDLSEGLELVTGVHGSAKWEFSTKVAGSYTVTATLVDGDRTREIGSLPITFIAAAPDPSRFTLTSSTLGQVKEPNGFQWHEVTVTIRDRFGNAVTDTTSQLPVSFSLSGAGAEFAASSPESGFTTSGVLTTRIVAQSPVLARVTALQGEKELSVAGTPTSLPLTFGWGKCADPAMCPPPPCSSSANTSYTLVPTTSRVMGEESFMLTARLGSPTCDGTPMSGQARYLKVRAQDTVSQSLAEISEVREVKPGVYQARISSSVVGTKAVTVTWSDDDGASLRVPPLGSSKISFVANPLPHWSTSWFDVTSAAREADGSDAQEIVVSLVDAHDNPVTKAESRIRATAVHGLLGSPDLATIGKFVETSPGLYAANVTTKVAGTYVVDVEIAGTTAKTADRSPLVRSNRYASFVAKHSGWAELTVAPPAGSDSRALRVKVLDGPGGNPVSGAEVTFQADPGTHLAGSDQRAITVVTGAFGVAEITFAPSVGGTPPVTAKVKGLSPLLTPILERAQGGTAR